MAGAISLFGNVLFGLPSRANQINYDNTNSGLSATQVQAAVDELNNKLTNVTTVTVTTNHQAIQSPNVHAEKLGKILIVSGYFYVANGQDFLKDELLFTVNQSITKSVFTSLVSSTGANARLKLDTNGKIYSEYTFTSGCFYAFEMVAFTN